MRRLSPQLRNVGAVVAVAVAIAFRIPTFLSTRHLGYDDGVYASSIMLMRQGFDPFRDFFSSQGPFFLPFVRVFDMIGIGGLRAPRSAMAATAAALAVALYVLVAMDHSPFRATAAALIGASSGLLLTAAGPIQSDGLALALGLFALVAAAGDHQRHPWLAPLAGVLVGLGLATKSLHLIPLAIAVLILIWVRAQRTGLVAAVFSAATAGILITLPWGFEDVWDQYVLFHLSRGFSFDPLDSLGTLFRFILQFELPLVVVVLAGVALRLSRPGPILTAGSPRRIPTWLLVAWLAATMFSLVFVTGVVLGMHRFVAFLIPPLILLAMRSPLPGRLAVVFMVIAVPFQWANIPLMDAVHPSGTELEAIEAMSTIPEDRFIVTDEPGLAWSAGRVSHPDTVDVSFGRMYVGDITLEDVSSASADEQTCAFLSWSHRFSYLEIDQAPPGYGVALADGDQFLAIRPGC